MDSSPGSMHDPVQPSSIVLAGDSSDPYPCSASIQLIRQLNWQRRSSSILSISTGGERVPLSQRAGVAVLRAYCHHTEALSSNLNATGLTTFSARYRTLHRVTDLWLSKPPRARIYRDSRDLRHPLVSPACAESRVGAPPI